jgi:hypothetical protein
VSRLIFWVDLRFFHGSMLLLFVLNAVFPCLIAACLVFLLHRLQPQRPLPGGTRTMVAALLVVLTTSWVQSENFTWAFQSQFFLDYLLPLLAFTLLAHAQTADCRRSFWLAWLAGVVSAGTMANGTLALPLLTVQALLLGLRKRDIGVLLLTAILVLSLYFHDYHTSLHYIASKKAFAIFEHNEVVLLPSYNVQPHAVRMLDWVGYVLLFLGGPWYFVLQKVALWPAMAAGAGWLVLALAATYRVLRRRPAPPYPVALLMLLAYIGAAALGAAHGRIVLGVEQALASRYLTPQLMAWTSLLLLSVYLWPRVVTSRLALGIYAALVLLLLPAQWQSLGATEYLAGLRIPALAVQLGVRDFEQIGPLSYEGERTFLLARQARREHLAVFGEPDMRVALQYWSGDAHSLAAQTPQVRCQGYVDTIESIDGVPGVVRVRGWLYDPQGRQTPSLILFSGERGRGVALGGLWRPDVGRALNKPHASTAGFAGYLQAPLLVSGAPVTLTGWIGRRPVCTLTLDLPAPKGGKKDGFSGTGNG